MYRDNISISILANEMYSLFWMFERRRKYFKDVMCHLDLIDFYGKGYELRLELSNFQPSIFLPPFGNADDEKESDDGSDTSMLLFFVMEVSLNPQLQKEMEKHVNERYLAMSQAPGQRE